MGTKRDGSQENREGFKEAKNKTDFESDIDKKRAAVEKEKIKKEEKRENREEDRRLKEEKKD